MKLNRERLKPGLGVENRTKLRLVLSEFLGSLCDIAHLSVTRSLDFQKYYAIYKYIL